MGPQAEADLLQACAQRLGSQLGEREEHALVHWWESTKGRAIGLSGALFRRPEADWAAMIREHRAHRHRWYDQLACEVSAQEFAAFLLENRAFPAFLPLLERILPAQICEEGRAAILRNIADEQVPVPHADLMRRLIAAVKAKAGDGVPIESYPTLVDRTLVFYYGYYCDAWNLVGSLYATEVMAYHRVTHMGAGLARLGVDATELEFIRIHSVCDEDHAREWSEGVIGPSLRVDPRLRRSIVEGIAACLETSARYLESLSRRDLERSDGGRGPVKRARAG